MQDLCSPGKCSYVILKDRTDFIEAGEKNRSMVTVLRNHRIIEWFGLEGTLKIIWFQRPCHKQGPLSPAQGAQSPVQPGLEPCQGGGSHSFSGQPGPGPHHPHGEELLPDIQSKSALF